MISLYRDSIYVKCLERGSIDTKQTCGCLGLGVALTTKELVEILKSWWKYSKTGLVNAKIGNEDCTALLE